MSAELPPEAYWFGDRPVDPADKQGLVGQVFESVASRYDLMNDLMSGGLHRLWKRRFVSVLRPAPSRALVDLAGGTGDIALGWLARGGGPVTLIDINAAMLTAGRDKALDRGASARIRPVCGSAEALPLEDASVATLSMAFGLRNVTDIDQALREARRVLRPGGRFHCLEFSPVTGWPLRPAYDAWSALAIPRIGRLVAGDADSYRYLGESIRRFPDREALAARMAEAGLERIRIEPLSGGIAMIHSGVRL